jgi:hypothetical protein
MKGCHPYQLTTHHVAWPSGRRARWRVASGEWRVASGEWRVASGRMINLICVCPLFAISYAPTPGCSTNHFTGKMGHLDGEHGPEAGGRRARWRVASGEWRVASGEWRVASGENVSPMLCLFDLSPVTSRRVIPLTDHTQPDHHWLFPTTVRHDPYTPQVNTHA